jgi:hypothetical protein
MAPSFELGAQFDVVEDLAVEDDRHGAVVDAHRLLAVCQVDDRQAGVREPDAARHVEAGLVRAAMADTRHGTLERTTIDLCIA